MHLVLNSSSENERQDLRTHMISAKGTREEMNMKAGLHSGLLCFFNVECFRL